MNNTIILYLINPVNPIHKSKRTLSIKLFKKKKKNSCEFHNRGLAPRKKMEMPSI